MDVAGGRRLAYAQEEMKRQKPFVWIRRWMRIKEED